MQGIITKTNLFLLLTITLLCSCNTIKSGRVTYTFANKVSEDFLEEQKEKVQSMVGEETVEEMMNMVRDVNSKRIYTLLFQEDKTVFSLDSEWLGKEDPNKTYINYSSEEVVISMETDFRTEAFSPVKWKILDETKKIDKWNVRKATADFDGQKIIAWFAKHPTLRIAPKNYIGLDGIVVEIELEKGAKYTLTDLEFDDSIKVDLPQD